MYIFWTFLKFYTFLNNKLKVFFISYESISQVSLYLFQVFEIFVEWYFRIVIILFWRLHFFQIFYSNFLKNWRLNFTKELVNFHASNFRTFLCLVICNRFLKLKKKKHFLNKKKILKNLKNEKNFWKQTATYQLHTKKSLKS